MDTDIQALFRGLQALSVSAFPKRCATCGREFTSPEDFIAQSQAINGKSGLKKSWDDDDKTIVELYRNCLCGSTLMDFFSDRRDTSARGLARREVFEKALLLLESCQVAREVGRGELLKVMRGQASDVLDRLGIRLRLVPKKG